MTKFEYRGYDFFKNVAWREIGFEVGYGVGGVWKFMLSLWNYTLIVRWVW